MREGCGAPWGLRLGGGDISVDTQDEENRQGMPGRGKRLAKCWEWSREGGEVCELDQALFGLFLVRGRMLPWQCWVSLRDGPGGYSLFLFSNFCFLVL